MTLWHFKRNERKKKHYEYLKYFFWFESKNTQHLSNWTCDLSSTSLHHQSNSVFFLFIKYFDSNNIGYVNSLFPWLVGHNVHFIFVMFLSCYMLWSTKHGHFSECRVRVRHEHLQDTCSSHIRHFDAVSDLNNHKITCRHCV